MRKLRLQSAILLLILSSITLTSCGKSAPHTSPENEKRPVVGDLGPAVEQLYSGKYLTACDRTNLPKMLEVARAVDLHKAEIDAHIASLPQTQNSKNFKYVQMGPIVVRENLQELAQKSGWKITRFGWKEIFADYEIVLSNPTPKNWSYLNSTVRGILTDDQSRVVDGYPYSIGYEDEPTIRVLLEHTRKCVADASCVMPTFPAAGMNWLLKQRDYPELLEVLKKSSDHSSSEKALATFEKYLALDLQNFEMRKNEKITRKGSTLTLPLYAGVFSGVTEQLSNYIDSVWKSSELSLKIDWVSASPDLFTFLLSPDAGGRPYVRYKDRQIVLFNDVKAKSIAHEIGHVLGFKDHYFDIWDENQCQYQTQVRADDLMSDSTFGLVTDEEWRSLQRTYPE